VWSNGRPTSFCQKASAAGALLVAKPISMTRFREIHGGFTHSQITLGQVRPADNPGQAVAVRFALVPYPA